MSKYFENNDYVDFYNYVDKPFEVEFTVAPMLFTSGLLTLPTEAITYAWNWNIEPCDYNDEEKKKILSCGKQWKSLLSEEEKVVFDRISYITGDVIYNGKKYDYGVKRVYSKKKKSIEGVYYQTSSNFLQYDDDISANDWNKEKSHEAKRIDKGAQVLITLSDEVVDELEKVFLVTQFYSRMSHTTKGSIDEKIQAKLIYYVEEQQPKLNIEITACIQKQGNLMINEREIDADLCRDIEQKFREAHIIFGAESGSDKEVKWKKPFDWIVVPKEGNNPDKYDETEISSLKGKEQLKATNAVYMWVGHLIGKPNEKYLYIGIVGVRDNEGNTVGKRILDQERKIGIAYNNGIIIDKLRLSEMDSCGESVSIDEALQTVEMQCINNFSAIFGYADSSKPKEDIISNLFDGVTDNEGNSFTMRLLNNKKRYHNDGK